MAVFRSFGKNPSGIELERLQASPNFKEGNFQNLSATTMMVSKIPMPVMLWKFLNKPKRTSPPSAIPSVKTNLKDLPADKATIVWFGHSSYLISINGITILVDPVMSGHASPFSFGANSFPGSDAYKVDDLPEIDILLITHDHYDHLDHRTFAKLMPKVKQVCTSLGVGSHLQYWGMPKEKITEFDWWDAKEVLPGFRLTAAPARHFSGRSTIRNKTLWASYILQAADLKIYIGADSGYDSHFKMIGEKFGGFDLAIVETGQYNTNWPFIHMMPEQAVQASIDLHAKWMMPVHWAKFALSFHDWDEPVKRVVAKAKELDVKVTTPMIGEPVFINEHYPQQEWWTQLK